MASGALTAKQKALLQAVRTGGGRDGIYALAATLGRNYRRVYENVRRMQAQGYLRLLPITHQGRPALAVEPAVTGAVMTSINVSLPEPVTSKNLLAALKTSRPLARREQTALGTFFSEVPPTLAIRFLNEHGIPLAQAARAYQSHVRRVQPSHAAEAWLYAA